MGNRMVFVLSLAGLGVAGFLWWTHVQGLDIPCGGSSGCSEVAASPYSVFLGYPVAAFGSALYLFIAAAAFMRALASSPRSDRLLLLLIIAAAVVGAGFSLWLTYVELFVIHAICRWCIASQIIILAVAAVAIYDWMRGKPRQLSPRETS